MLWNGNSRLFSLERNVLRMMEGARLDEDRLIGALTLSALLPKRFPPVEQAEGHPGHKGRSRNTSEGALGGGLRPGRATKAVWII